MKQYVFRISASSVSKLSRRHALYSADIMSRVMIKPAFCICQNNDIDQLYPHLSFRYTDSTIPLLPKSEISSLWPSSVVVQPILCQTWSETSKTCFLESWLL